MRPSARPLAVVAAAILGVLVAPRTPAAPSAGKPVPFALDLPVAPGRFTWPSPLAQRNDLYAVKGTPDGARIWAAGAAGTVLSLRGVEAKLETTGTTADLYDIWVAAPNDIWVVGDRGTILHGDGKRWSPVRSGTKRALYSIWARSSRDLWIGGDAGTFLHGDGTSWRAVSTPTKGPIAGVVGCNTGEICALTLADLLPMVEAKQPCRDPDGDCPIDEAQEPEGTRILRWDGAQWLPYYFGAGYQARRLVAAGAALWVIDDGYANISVFRDGKSEAGVSAPKDTEMVHLAGAWAGGETDGWVVGARCTQDQPPAGPFSCNRGAIWRFDGRKASLRKELPPGALVAVWAWSKRGAIAVGERGTIVRFDGTAWTPVSRSVTEVDLRGVVTVPAAPDKDKKTAVLLTAAEHENEPKPRTATLTIPGTPTGTWALPRPSGAAPASHARDQTDVWVFGDCEAFRASSRGWVTFFPEVCETGAATRKLLAVDSGDVWMLPSSMMSSHTPWPGRWDGRAWTTVRSPSSAFPRDIWGSRGDDVWIVGGRDAVHWDGRALAESAPLPGIEAADELRSVWGSDANNVWVAALSAAAGTAVKLLRWDGDRWQPAASFRLDLPRRERPSDPAAASNLYPARYVPSQSVVLWGTSASDVWLAGPNGIVIRFDGSRWWRVPTPTRDQLLGLGGTRDRVVVVGPAGTILQLDVRLR